MGSLSAALATGNLGTVPDGSGLVKEELVVTGSSAAAGDTGTYTTIMKQPQRLEGGGLSYAISGQVVTITDEAGLGNAATGASIYGYQ
jgi:hypothetical protein